MMITKMSLPRRTFLRGMGATVALPLLDAMVPALTAFAKTPAAPIRRFGVVYVPNGMIMPSWTPRHRRCARALADPPTARALPGSHARIFRAGWPAGPRRHPHDRRDEVF